MNTLVAILSAAALISATSVMTYFILRNGWRLMCAARNPHGRVLYAVAAAFATHVVGICLYGLVFYFLATNTDLGTLRDATPEGYEPFTPWVCFYFSAATYSSLGFGDIVPMGELRLIAVMEGLNGLMLIAWTAAYSFLAMEEFWEKPQRRKT